MTVEEHPEVGRYLVNSTSHEIHDGQHHRPECNIKKMMDDPTNVRRVQLNEFKALLLEGFDLCDHCFGDKEGAE